MSFSHVSVLLEESINGLNINPDGVYIDGTAGGAGHSAEIAKRLSDKGRLIALDMDPDAVKAASERLAEYKNAIVVKSNFTDVKEVLKKLDIDKADGMLMDLGVSSHQLDTAERGFSYHNDAPLDMRMSQEGLSAKDIINEFSEEELTRILFEYGEEKFARRISANIIKSRQMLEIKATGELAEIIKKSVPAYSKREKNPCKRTFQAIRIAVNGELESLSDGLDNAFECLKSGGRLAVITFHSLEDRLVKQRYNNWCRGCICPPDFPQCVCGHEAEGKLVNRKPIEPSEKEKEINNRSRSAKLRIIERI